MTRTAPDASDFIRGFIAERTHRTPGEIGDDVDLFAVGLLDSLGLLDLVMAVEERFGVAIDLVDVDLERLSCVGDFAALVERPAPSASEATA